MKTRRLFFALWPTEQVRQSVIEAAKPVIQELDGRIIDPHNLHITLHFIGQVNEDIKDCMHAAARAVEGKSFKLELNRFGHFSRAKIFWMGSQDTPAKLIQLHDRLAKELSKCGYQCDKRPYNPHITLLRKVARREIKKQAFSIPWQVNDFALVESVQGTDGVEYLVIEQYPLS